MSGKRPVDSISGELMQMTFRTIIRRLMAEMLLFEALSEALVPSPQSMQWRKTSSSLLAVDCDFIKYRSKFTLGL
jgi:hypothetical protein